MIQQKAAAESVRLRVSDGTEMRAYVARPESPTTAVAGIVVLQEVYGVTDYLREVTARLADELGVLAIAPELYHRTGEGAVGDYESSPKSMDVHRGGLTNAGLAADVVAAWEWLRNEGIAAERTAAIGFCMGGRVAFLANAHVPFAAVISLYGGRIAPDYLDIVAQQHAPLLFFWAGLDHTIPAEQRRAVEDALVAADVVTHTHVTFSDAHHGFFCHAKPAGYHAGAAREVWAMTTEFLRNTGVLGAA